MEEMQPASGGAASYAVLAHIITAFYNVEPPVYSRQVHAWFRRGTRNRAGVKFPDPVRENEAPRRGQPHYLFPVRDVLEWYGAGVPAGHGGGWRVPGVDEIQE
jgi:hypothetical protein